MKTSTKIVVFVLSLMAHWVSAQQPDSTRIIYSQETDSLPPKQNTRLIRALYRRFIRAQIEEKTLIKLGALPATIGTGAGGSFMWGFKSELAVEQKLTPALSVLLAGRTKYQHFGPNSNESATINGLLASRWYVNMLKRIRQRKSANNFSDQYLTVELNKRIWSKAASMDPTLIPIIDSQVPSVRIGLGLQRRLSRLGYLDTSLGVDYLPNRPRPIGITLSFFAGLGL